MTGVIDSIDYLKFDSLILDCVNAIKDNKSIIATGLGKNESICEKFIGTLTSIGISSYFLNTNSAVHGDLGSIKNGDVVLMLTKSGETIESVYLYHFLKKRNIKIWLLSFNESSTLSSLINDKIIMNLDSEGDRWNLIPNNSSISFLLVLQGLAMRLLDDLDISIDIFRGNHPGGHIGKILDMGLD
jgi:arabinose-5-phosphate isomerase